MDSVNEWSVILPLLYLCPMNEMAIFQAKITLFF
jgi:hypothetical protein